MAVAGLRQLVMSLLQAMCIRTKVQVFLHRDRGLGLSHYSISHDHKLGIVASHDLA